MTDAGEDRILEVINRVVLVLINLSCRQGDSNVVQWLMDQEADVEFETDSQEIGNMSKGVKRSSNVMPVSRDHLGHR